MTMEYIMEMLAKEDLTHACAYTHKTLEIGIYVPLSHLRSKESQCIIYHIIIALIQKS